MLKAVVDEAVGVGINMPLIPVLDINQNPDNPIICTRAFLDSPEDVSCLAQIKMFQLNV
jgi:beta-glucosidase-like glycosyl hydrolase